MKKPGSSYYEGAFRYVINGVPCRFPRKLSAHQIAVLSLDDTRMKNSRYYKKFREMAQHRFAETTYGPCDNGVYRSYADPKQVSFIFWRDGKKSDQFFSKGDANEAFAGRQAA